MCKFTRFEFEFGVVPSNKLYSEGKIEPEIFRNIGRGGMIFIFENGEKSPWCFFLLPFVQII